MTERPRAYRKTIMIHLGVIGFPVDIVPSTTSEESLTSVCIGGMLDPHPPTVIHSHPSCDTCGNSDVPSFKRARQVGKDNFVVVEVEEYNAAVGAAVGVTAKNIHLTAHPRTEVTSATLQGKKTGGYYLIPSAPSKGPVDPGMLEKYAGLVDLIRRHPELAFCSLWTPSTRPSFYMFGLFGDTIVMEPRARVEEVKVIQQPSVPQSAGNQAVMDMLLNDMATKTFDPVTYADVAAQNLAELLAAREAGTVPLLKPAAPSGVSLTEMLAQYAATRSAA